MSELPVKAKTKNILKDSTESDDVIIRIGEKIADSNSQQEIVILTQVRGELLRQDYDFKKKNKDLEDRSKDKALRRRNEWFTLVYKFVFSPVAVIVGCWLIISGFLYAGLLALGAGLWLLASELVKGYLLGGVNDNKKS